MIRFIHLIATILMTSVLIACGGQTPSSDTGESSETSQEVVDSVDSSAGKTLKKSTSSAPSNTGKQFQEVQANNLETYTYSTGLFQIDIPQGWQSQDTSKPGEVIIIWTDVSRNALVSVDIFNGEGLTTDNLPNLLQTFLTQQFGANPNFAMEEPEVQPDGSIQIVWGFDVSVEGANGRLQGNSFIEQKGNKISLLTLGVPTSQFNRLQKAFNDIANSYSFNPEIEIP